MMGQGESSVLASIEDLLRDEQRRKDVQAATRQRAAAADERARIERALQAEAEAARRAEAEHVEQLRAIAGARQKAELRALHHATLERARTEAETDARLAEIRAQHEHEQRLDALENDKSKRRLRVGAVALGLLLVGSATTGGIVISRGAAERTRLEAELRTEQDARRGLEAEQAKLGEKLRLAHDPEAVAALAWQLDTLNQQIKALAPGAAPTVQPPTTRSTATIVSTAATLPTSPRRRCPRGDPSCVSID